MANRATSGVMALSILNRDGKCVKAPILTQMKVERAQAHLPNLIGFQA